MIVILMEIGNSVIMKDIVALLHTTTSDKKKLFFRRLIHLDTDLEYGVLSSNDFNEEYDALMQYCNAELMARYAADGYLVSDVFNEQEEQILEAALKIIQEKAFNQFADMELR